MGRAVILAGGRGTRLRPYTVVFPKPLMPIGDSPILEIIVRQLARQGFDRITLAVNHQADLLRAYFGDGSKWNVRIDYSLEHMALSTMAPLKLVADLPDDFLVMNGDILTDMSYADLMKEHVQEGRLFTISAAYRQQQVDYGVLDTGGGELLRGFQEKPCLSYLVSMGVYCANRRLLDWIPSDRPFGFDELCLALIAQQQQVRVRVHQGYWLDIGRPDDYQKAIEDWPKTGETLLK